MIIYPQANIARIKNIDPFTTTAWIYAAGEQAAGQPEIIYLARSIVRELRERDPVSEALAIADFMERRVRYTLDPERFEVVFGPMELLKMWRRFGRWAEDCDTISATTYALLRSIGHRVRVAIASFDSVPQPEHIFIETLINGSWYTLDPAEKERASVMVGSIRYKWIYPPN